MAKDDEKCFNYLLQTQMKNKFCFQKFDINCKLDLPFKTKIIWLKPITAVHILDRQELERNVP